MYLLIVLEVLYLCAMVACENQLFDINSLFLKAFDQYHSQFFFVALRFGMQLRYVLLFQYISLCITVISKKLCRARTVFIKPGYGRPIRNFRNFSFSNLMSFNAFSFLVIGRY